MTILDDLETFFLTEIAVNLDKESLNPDEDLLEQGIVDSLGVIKVIVFIEETFGIKVIDKDIVPENFQTLNALNNLIEKIKAEKE